MPKRPTTKKKRRVKTKPQHAEPTPLWVPTGNDIELLPEEVRQAITQIIQPVYKRFVISSDDPLEKSLGVTVTHLLWLEILQQADLKRQSTEISSLLGTQTNYQNDIDQHLRIIESKVKVGYLLTRIRELRHRWGHQPTESPTFPKPADSATIDIESIPAPDRDLQ